MKFALFAGLGIPLSLSYRLRIQIFYRWAPAFLAFSLAHLLVK
jgi:hypothetical protein